MKSFQEFINESYLTEGGWATVKTQNTTITPDVIAKVVKIIDAVSKDFNDHLKGLNLPPLEFMKPIGSGTWWEEDLQDQPDKTYGDIDFMVAYPTIQLTENGEKADENATVKLYNEELLNWLDSIKNPNIDVEESRKISTPSSVKLLAVVDLDKDNQGYVQVDMVVTHTQYKDWAVFRFTPMRNVKGFVIGKLYTALGNALDLSIQVKGVRVKYKNDVHVKYSSRGKDVDEKLISQSASSFLQDTTKFFWENSETDKSFDDIYFSDWKGINPNSPKIEDFCDGIIALAKTLEQLGEFGGTIKYKSAKEFLTKVADEYKVVMIETYHSTKFDKAATPAANAAIEKIRSLITTYVEVVENKLRK
jgi:hypothetical protein